MFSSLRTRFGIPGVISVIALVFAMIGGAYAANDSGNGSKASASAKAKKGPRGPRGPAGPAGPQGPAGPAGAKGDTGAAGAKGADGAQGPKGDTGATGATGAKGATGSAGAEGSPWTAGGTLPSEATETGTWAFGSTGPGEETVTLAPISYPLPLPGTPEEIELGIVAATSLIGEGSPGTVECPGTAKDPQALPGNLCVYVANITGPAVIFGVFSNGSLLKLNTGKAGAVIGVGSTGEGARGGGTFAVTAPAG